ncbi:MAG: SRPBCC family protein [Thermoanaerobaculia bacterium]|nr:SRPBCC family protein [Thermoanaerobaculia bacterium]
MQTIQAVPVDAGRVVRSYTQHIEASPDTVFPLLCPVREVDWLEGWGEGLEIVHTESGVAEEGCVFRKRSPDRTETVWMVTRHDPIQRVVEFFRVTTGLVATRLQIEVAARDDGSSTVEITYTFTPLGEEGRALVAERYGEEAFRRDMIWWEDSMHHWLRTGEVLRAAA